MRNVYDRENYSIVDPQRTLLCAVSAAEEIIVLTIRRITIFISNQTQKRCNNTGFSGEGYLESLYVILVFFYHKKEGRDVE